MSKADLVYDKNSYELQINQLIDYQISYFMAQIL